MEPRVVKLPGARPATVLSPPVAILFWFFSLITSRGVVKGARFIMPIAELLLRGGVTSWLDLAIRRRITNCRRCSGVT